MSLSLGLRGEKCPWSAAISRVPGHDGRDVGARPLGSHTSQRADTALNRVLNKILKATADVFCSVLRCSASAQNAGGLDLDGDGIIDTAASDAGNSGDRGLFGQALQFLNSNKPSANDDVDEERVTSAHQQAYG